MDRTHPGEAPEATHPRRRLLAGSLAAPMVLTVTSAAGRSRTTFTACLDNARLQPKPNRVLPRGATEPDEWLRVQISIYEMGFSNADGGVALEPGRYFIGPDKVSVFKLGEGNSESTPAILVTRFNAHTPKLIKREVEKRYALAYANADAKIVGYAWQSNGGTHCKKSCFSSVVARAKA